MVLSRKGKMVICKSADVNAVPNGDETKKFDWGDAVIDSLIYASGFGVGSLVTGIADGGISILDIQIAALLFAGAFIAFLRIKRSIPKEVKE